MKPVAANVPLPREVPVDSVGRGRGRQVVEERGVEDSDVRQARQRLAGHFDSEHRGRVMEFGQGRELLQLRYQSVVDHRWLVEIGTTVHHPMPHCDKSETVERLSGLGEFLERDPQRFAVVGDRPITDPLDDPLRHHRSRVRLNDGVFQ